MSSPKKIIDIIPSKDFKKKLFVVIQKPKKKSQRKSVEIPMLKLSIALVVLLLIGGVASLHFVFQRATITVWPVVERMSLTQRITVVVGSEEINIEEREIPGVTLSLEKEATQLFDATGSQASATKAQGSIKVSNERSVVQMLIINTRFVSEDGFVFRTTKRIEIPPASGSGPGVLDVTVVAAQAGPEYNIGASNFSIPGLAGSSLYTKIYGESESAMVGGSTGNTTVVTQADIDRAGESLIATLTVRAKRDLRGGLSEGFIMADDGFSVDVLESSSVVKPGAALTQFNYSATVLLKTIVFATADLEELSRTVLALELEEGKSLNTATLKASYEVKDLDIDEGRLAMEVTASVDSYGIINIEGFANLVGGTTPSTAAAILRGEGVGKTQVNLWPFWLTKVPSAQDKINILIHVD